VADNVKNTKVAEYWNIIIIQSIEEI